MNKTGSKKVIWGLLALMLLLSLVFFFVTRSTKTEISDDPLVQGIVERWGAGLPGGFEKISAEHVENGSGRLFARLEYEKDIASLLKKWKRPDDVFINRFDAILDAQLKDAATTQQEAEMISSNRPAPDEAWISFVLEDEEHPDAVLMLCYRQETKEMFLAEEWK